MTENLLHRTRGPAEFRSGARARRVRKTGPAGVALSAAAVLLLILAAGALLEMRSSFLQSRLLSQRAAEMTFALGLGPAGYMPFPSSGPYDERLGYSRIPSFAQSLGVRQYVIEDQARLSPTLQQLIEGGGYAVFHEKPRTGLTLLDRAGEPLYAARFPQRAYGIFQNVPPLVIRTLLFVEDQHLLDDRFPRRNPAADWPRLLQATWGRIGWVAGLGGHQGGASTLATQIEKFRHSPGGMTRSLSDKFRQMAAAGLRAYLDGPDTTRARRQIVATYLDSTTLASRLTYGEVIGIGDGLWAWYGTELEEANRLLMAPATPPEAQARQATVYKQLLSLILAERRPAYYLVSSPEALEPLTNRYLRLLFDAGVIDQGLFHAALKTKLQFRVQAPPPQPVSFVERKAQNALRAELVSLLGLTDVTALDRLDLSVRSTLDREVQARVTGLLRRLSDPAFAGSQGLLGKNLLPPENLDQVAYSVVLYERGGDHNYLRVHADSLDQPFDINSGAKLILGSTAKLRTLITYLDIVADLHRRLGMLSSAELASLAARPGDPLTRWGAGYLTHKQPGGLPVMLDAAMQRRYSASPYEVFFTGSGEHVFHNFDKSEDNENPTVEEAFERSINLAFVRLLRDITRYYLAQEASSVRRPLTDKTNPAREDYLRQFADREGRQYLDRFYADYRGLKPDESLALLASRTEPEAYRLAVVFRSLRPRASVDELVRFLELRIPQFEDGKAADLYAKYAPDRFSLNDRGYLAGVHPLELWLAAYLQTQPGASRAELFQASTAVRQQAYAWLFKTRNARKQDVRIRIMLEAAAFRRILEDWRRQGYPFDQLVPSFGTAIGSSGDRPDALAELMGVIMSGGVRVPSVDVEGLRFAAATPYETGMAFHPPAAERVLAPEVAVTVRRALESVVARGTGQRLRDAYRDENGVPLAVGGKTGTGDNRFVSFGAGRQIIASSVVNRTATFVFFLGDRFYGTVTAYVQGPQAAKFQFTSALTVQLVRVLAGELKPLWTEAKPEVRG
jgi:membrane peptidoglycan carboxypeptidase